MPRFFIEGNMDDDDVFDDDGERESYDSGPFCQHWGDPADCDHLCTCGHECCRHWADEGCQVDGCSCESFVDEDK